MRMSSKYITTKFPNGVYVYRENLAHVARPKPDMIGEYWSGFDMIEGQVVSMLFVLGSHSG
jgi:hypothetical protein